LPQTPPMMNNIPWPITHLRYLSKSIQVSKELQGLALLISQPRAYHTTLVVALFSWVVLHVSIITIILSVFRTREDRQPTSKFVAACPCPDGLMQDGTQEGNVAYVFSHRGARSSGYKRRETARARARGRRPTLSALPRLSATCLRKVLDIPFIDTRRCPAVQWGVAAS
jgi:hypothetical protein